MSELEFVIFGGTGDLAWRKLIPSLFTAHRAGLLPEAIRILATGSSNISNSAYKAALGRNVLPGIDPAHRKDWDAFTACIEYLRVNAHEPAHFDELSRHLHRQAGTITVCYLATAPRLFVPICEQLARQTLNSPQVRIVLEKPLGHDLASCEAINSAVAQYFHEDQIYRIDHYLGKEPVQNLMALRFGNALFEPLWRREWIRDVQITLAEKLGVEGRGEFYEATGAMRDMVQNHLLQLLCMVAMEPPADLSAHAIRAEKIKVLKALKPILAQDVEDRTVRGQYRWGTIDGHAVDGYLNETGIAHSSHTETFVSIKSEIANWRWQGVPFFLRTGKRLASHVAEIVVNFRDVPHALFDQTLGGACANRLVIQLQPEESIRLHCMVKQPGDDQRLHPVSLDLDFAKSFKTRRAGAYERLLLDVIRGNLSLFVHRDEQAQAWRWVAPILEAWQASATPPHPYLSGSWGPAASAAMISHSGSAWHEQLQSPALPLSNNTA